MVLCGHENILDKFSHPYYDALRAKYLSLIHI